MLEKINNYKEKISKREKNNAKNQISISIIVVNVKIK